MHTNGFLFRPSSCGEPKEWFQLETIMVCVKPVHPSERGILEEVNLILVGEKGILSTVLANPKVTYTIASTFFQQSCKLSHRVLFYSSLDSVTLK